MKNKRANIRSFASNNSPYLRREKSNNRKSGTFGSQMNRQNMSRSMKNLDPNGRSKVNYRSAIRNTETRKFESSFISADDHFSGAEDFSKSIGENSPGHSKKKLRLVNKNRSTDLNIESRLVKISSNSVMRQSENSQ
jgi:hypothetical protein